jgi:DNA-binding NtrC family response regulator
MSFDALDEMLEEISPPSNQLGSDSDEQPLVLIIDDDSQMLESIHLLLSKRYRIVSCASAADGVSQFTGEVCTVIVDVKMEQNDGFWACDEIRKLAPDIPIIFYSAYQNVKDPFDIINMHRPFAYLMKDGDPTRLLNIVDVATRLYDGILRSRRMIEGLRPRSHGHAT